MATPEAKVKTACKRVLKDFGIHYFMPMQNGYGIVGVSDIICCWNGWYLAIETKAPGKKAGVTANQASFLRSIQQHGGLALVIDDAQELRSILMDILKLRKEQSNGSQNESTGEIQVEEPAEQTGLQEGGGVQPQPGADSLPGGAEQKESGIPQIWID